MLKVILMGPGRLGLALAQAINEFAKPIGFAQVIGIVSRCNKRANLAAQQTGSLALTYGDPLPMADLYAITTSDDAIAETASWLYSKTKFSHKQCVFHCSGALSSAILSPMNAPPQAQVASMHPLKSFTDANESDSFDKVWVGLEGDAAAIEILSKLCTCLRAKPITIDKNLKALYHAASVFAANYSITLHHLATTCFIKAGVDGLLAKQLTQDFMAQSLLSLSQAKHAAVLTGPIKRGDLATLEKHIAALTEHMPPSASEAYQALALATAHLLKNGDT